MTSLEHPDSGLVSGVSQLSPLHLLIPSIPTHTIYTASQYVHELETERESKLGSRYIPPFVSRLISLIGTYK